MSSSPGPDSYVRRNLPPLIVGLAAIVAIVGGLIVVIDRSGGDDGDRVAFARDGSPFAEDDGDERTDDFERRLDGDFGDLLEELVGDQLLLGVSLDEDDGALVVDRVVAGTPADQAGIEAGDVIREVNGDRVRTVEELREAIAAIEVGDDYELAITRDGDDETVSVRREITIGAAMAALLERFADEGFDLDDFDLDDFDSEAPNRRFEFQGGDDPFEGLRLRPTLGLSIVQTNEGLRVMRVDPGSVAAEAGIEPGDIILEADGEPMETIDDLRGALPTLTALGTGELAEAQVLELLVLRDGGERSLEARFPASMFPILPIPLDPSLPNATPGPDMFAQEFLDRLQELETRLDSDEFLDRLDEGLRDRLEALIDQALAARLAEEAAEAAEAAESADEPASFAGLDVYRGTVDLYSDDQIVLGGSRGAISFELTDETAVVGRQPRIGGISTVASDGNRQAMLVLTTN